MSVNLEILHCQNGKFGHAQLNSEATLNALSLEMIDSLYEGLTLWQKDPEIKFVFLDAAGEKAFCAGGDIVRLYKAIKDKDPYFKSFFEHEYKLDYLIHTFKKPIIAWGHGIVMGGGMGILQGCTFRVATEKTMMAMPEISIGLFPDVGASYFLQKCPRQAGVFLALSGTRINGIEARELHLADHCIEHAKKSEFLNALKNFQVNTSTNIKNEIQNILNTFESASNNISIKSQLEWNWIDAITQHKSAVDLYNFCNNQSALSPWAEKGRQNILRASPTSVAIIFEQFQRAQGKKLNEIFQMEWLVAVHCAMGHDFPEGVRALLIDKDNKAQWNPKIAADIDPKKITSHFELGLGLETNPLANLN